MSEEWKDILGFEGKYQASTLGNVRSLDRFVSTKFCKGCNLKPKLEKRGYLRLTLSANRFRKTDSVHRLVAISFIPNPENKLEVNHIDGDKTNNNVNNLEWATRLENSLHARNTGLLDSLSGTNSHFSVHSEEEVSKVVLYLRMGYTPSEVAKMTKISRPSCSKINLGQLWRMYLIDSLGIKDFPICETRPCNQFSNLVTKNMVEKAKELSSMGVPQLKIARELGLSQSSICRVLKRSRTL